MLRKVVLPCVLALGCSEYGFSRPEHPPYESPDPHHPPGVPPAGADDTGDSVPGRELDCDHAARIKIHELPIIIGSDFDGEGRTLFYSLHDIWAGELDGTLHLIASNVGYPRHPREPRVLPDGNLVYLSKPKLLPGSSHTDPELASRIGLLDVALGREVALTPSGFHVMTMEPDVDGSVYAAGLAFEPFRPMLRRYDLYGGVSEMLAEFDIFFHSIRRLYLALSPSGDAVYLAASIAPDAGDVRGVVYAVQRLDPWTWSDPIEIWSGGAVESITSDACGNLYISEGKRLLILARESGEVQQIADLPAPLQYPIWGSGVGDWPSDVLFGFAHSPQEIINLFVGIELGVDGNHVLTR